MPAADAGMFGGGGQGDGYPDKGKAIELLKPAADYSGMLTDRTRTLGIMRSRAQGFVPSPELHDYVKGVMVKLLAGVPLPPSFNPDVRILAAPEFAGECTPDGTLILTVGLLEKLDNEDQLAFVIGHELSHAIYQHRVADWYKKSQYYAVINGAAVDQGVLSVSVAAGANSNDVMRAIDVAQHVMKLSANVLAPQFEKGQEDAADALGFDMMVKAGYSTDAANAVLDKLAEQEAEAKAAADAAKAATSSSGSGMADDLFHKVGGVTGLMNLAQGHVDRETVTNISIFAFDSAVDNMSEDATTHHPAKEREKLLAAYEFREYRDTLPATPKPLPWQGKPKGADAKKMAEVMAHYSDAEDAAEVLAQTGGNLSGAQGAVGKAITVPTTDHAYTEYVAAEYYDQKKMGPQTEAALQKAVNGPEPSWAVYSKLASIYIARGDWAKAQSLMDQADARFDNSPVLYPKRIEVAKGAGRDTGDLVSQCKGAGIDELTAECKKAAGES
ncbi:MAG TPA: M48 family metallopeptidase [Rhizomicrobium sp.]|nr:M48 family metallopeptidase [Rhizomicrobium sp.]HEX4533751.1 M48 family metallopeptidase [Rhizomicrobium sp.]